MLKQIDRPSKLGYTPTFSQRDALAHSPFRPDGPGSAIVEPTQNNNIARQTLERKTPEELREDRLKNIEHLQIGLQIAKKNPNKREARKQENRAYESFAISVGTRVQHVTEEELPTLREKIKPHLQARTRRANRISNSTANKALRVFSAIHYRQEMEDTLALPEANFSPEEQNKIISAAKKVVSKEDFAGRDPWKASTWQEADRILKAHPSLFQGIADKILAGVATLSVLAAIGSGIALYRKYSTPSTKPIPGLTIDSTPRRTSTVPTKEGNTPTPATPEQAQQLINDWIAGKIKVPDSERIVSGRNRSTTLGALSGEYSTAYNANTICSGYLLALEDIQGQLVAIFGEEAQVNGQTKNYTIPITLGPENSDFQFQWGDIPQYQNGFVQAGQAMLSPQPGDFQALKAYLEAHVGHVMAYQIDAHVAATYFSNEENTFVYNRFGVSGEAYDYIYHGTGATPAIQAILNTVPTNADNLPVAVHFAGEPIIQGNINTPTLPTITTAANMNRTYDIPTASGQPMVKEVTDGRNPFIIVGPEPEVTQHPVTSDATFGLNGEDVKRRGINIHAKPNPNRYRNLAA